MKIELDLDLDGYLARHIRYDEEGEPVSEPVTLEDLIVGLAAQKLISGVIADEAKSLLRRRVDEVRTTVIREAVRPAVEEALTASLQPTDTWGQPKGEPKTLREHIIETTHAMLTKAEPQGYNKPTRTVVQGWIAETVNHVVKTELGKALEEGKAEVKAALKEQGAQLLTEAITRMTKV